MTAKFAKYDPDTGRILFCGEVPQDMVEHQGENVWVGEASPTTDYMDLAAGTPAPRPVMPVTIPDTARADGVTETTLASVPAGAYVRIRGPVNMEGAAEQGGDVTLTFALAGDYTILIECFPYLDLKGVIHAL